MQSSSRRDRYLTGSLRHRSLFATLLCLALALPALLLPGRTSGSEAERATMRRIFGAVQQLVPIALTDSFSGWDGQDSESIRSAVSELAQATKVLDEHARDHDSSFRSLASSMSADVRALDQQLRRKRYLNASYLTGKIVQTCISCHVRMPDAREHDFSQSLLAKVDRESLTPWAQGNLQAAARQFDAALQTWEAMFGDRASEPDLIELSEAINSYLVVTLRVQRKPERALRGIALLERRTDLAAQVHLNLRTWRAALKDVGPALLEPATLERAQAILDQGRALSEYPLDNADEIHAIVASALVFRVLEDARPQGEALAGALYLLARTESLTHALEVSASGSYLEQAIRAAPHTGIAERAYARLELQTLLEYSAEGQLLPPDVDAWLMELRKLSRTLPPQEEAPETALLGAID